MRFLDEYPPLRLGLRATQIVVAALFVGVVVFQAITGTLLATGRIERVEPPIVTWTLIAAGCLTLPAVLFVRHLILRAARRDALAGSSSTRGGLLWMPVHADTGLPQQLGRLFQGWQTATLVTAAGLEGAALMCTVATLVEGHEAGIVAALFFALLLLVFVPTSLRLEAWMESEMLGLRTSSGRGVGVD